MQNTFLMWYTRAIMNNFKGGDVDVVVNKYHYTDVTEVIPIFKQETLGITKMVVSKVEIY